ncbi:helix-turn-helix domain-containing protein [Ureibacillus endophyticus]|uniref:DNA-binding protein n=1 Tax=Ureibacillus endophyticus TaxID=1978490 RepID=A0A494Z669_9BACL|nr:helix-turn-helix domain-containing protein [Lysinibacillus endophyticus]RKQ17492.1 DNA-binding protein [Lysinibacillus endophyticus]
MNFKLELPEDIVLINKKELKRVLHEVLLDLQAEKNVNDVMTIRECADYLKVSVPTIRKMIANREIPYFQKGQVIRLSRYDITEWMRNQSDI